MTKSNVWTEGRGQQLLAACAVAVSVSAGTMWAQAPAAPRIGKTAKLPAGVYEVAASPSTGVVYVASAGSRGAGGAVITALNGRTLEVIKTYDVAAAPAYGVGLNDKTQTLYTTNSANSSMSAIDLKSGTVTSISSDVDPKAHLREVVADETTNTIYAASYATPGTIWVIDGKTNKISQVIQNVGNGTSGLVLDTAGKRLFATNMAGHEIVIVDLATKAVVQRFPSGGERPSNLAFDATANRLYSANQGPGTVTVLDAKDGKLLATLEAGAGTLDVELSANGALVFAANRTAANVTVFDAKTFTKVATLDTGGAPNTLAVDAKTGLVYVSKKARPAPRAARAGGAPAAPAAPAPPAEDPQADTITILQP